MKKKVFIFMLLLLISATATAKVVATVGQEKITQEDVQKAMATIAQNNPRIRNSISEEYVLDQIINLRIGSIEARSAGLDKTQEAKDAMESALVNYMLYSGVDKKIMNKRYSKKQITDYYKNNPVVKLQRIAMKYNPSDSKRFREANMRLSALRGDIVAKKITFEQAMTQLGDDLIADMSGTFDKIALPSLPGYEYLEAQSLKKGEISSILSSEYSLNLIRILQIYPISSEYYEPIIETLRAQEIGAERRKFFQNLRKKYSAIINVKN